MISLLLPTRQRPAQLTRLVDSAIATASGEIELVTFIDDDDTSYDDLDFDIEWVKVRGPRESGGIVNLSAMWNACYAASSGEIVMHCGDDIVFRTPGWDQVVYDTFDSYPDNLLFPFGQDGYQVNFGTHGFIHRDWVNTVGFLFPPRYTSDFNDTFLNDVSKLVGRHVEIDIYTEHMHYICGKAEIDLNTRERLDRHERCRPQDFYYSEAGQAEIMEAAFKLRSAIGESDH